MADKFLLIAITSPGIVCNEAVRLVSLLNNGFHYLHIRKPLWKKHDIVALIEKIPDKYHSRLILHDFHELIENYNLGGLHYNSRNPYRHNNIPYSASCHSKEDILKWPDARYVFLSPIYNSISKPDYKSAFNLKKISPDIIGHKVIALGGVTPEKLPDIKAAGFAGAAMMGFLWSENFVE